MKHVILMIQQQGHQLCLTDTNIPLTKSTTHIIISCAGAKKCVSQTQIFLWTKSANTHKIALRGGFHDSSFTVCLHEFDWVAVKVLLSLSYADQGSNHEERSSVSLEKDATSSSFEGNYNAFILPIIEKMQHDSTSQKCMW